MYKWFIFTFLLSAFLAWNKPEIYRRDCVGVEDSHGIEVCYMDRLGLRAMYSDWHWPTTAYPKRVARFQAYTAYDGHGLNVSRTVHHDGETIWRFR